MVESLPLIPLMTSSGPESLRLGYLGGQGLKELGAQMNWGLGAQGYSEECFAQIGHCLGILNIAR